MLELEGMSEEEGGGFWVEGPGSARSDSAGMTVH